MDTVTHETLTRGWQTELGLHSTRIEHRTVFTLACHHGPLTVQHPLYPEENVCHLYLLRPSAGIVGRGEFHTATVLNENSHALITQLGTGKFYRDRGPQTSLRQYFTPTPHITLK